MPSTASSPSPSLSSMKSILKTSKPSTPTPTKTVRTPVTRLSSRVNNNNSNNNNNAAVSNGETEAEVCLRWNSHHTNMQTAFPTLMDNEQYVDVTLAAEGNILKCHRVSLIVRKVFLGSFMIGNGLFTVDFVIVQHVFRWDAPNGSTVSTSDYFPSEHIVLADKGSRRFYV